MYRLLHEISCGSSCSCFEVPWTTAHLYTDEFQDDTCALYEARFEWALACVDQQPRRK